MRDALFWISGAAFAFLATAGAFLLLANLGTGPSERNLTPDPPPAESGPALELTLDRLTSLRALPGQELRVGVHNTGDEDLSHVNLTVEVSSENTALPSARYYRENLNHLSAGSSVPVPFYLDLSEAGTTSSASASAAPEPSRKIIEVRATTPEGVSAIKTAIVPL